MGEQSKIEWTDATWNPWQGCTKVSPACDHCYMFRDLGRYGKDPTVVFRSKPPTFNLPIRSRRGGEHILEAGKKVFTCSWSDWFHKAADAWRPEAWEIVRQRSDLTFQIVTKRVERIVDHLPADWGNGYPNVWLIATVENQEFADKRLPILLEIPSAVHGASIEPMLGPIDLTKYLNRGRNIHLGIDVNGALKNKSFDFFTDSNTGRKLSRGEAEIELKNYRNQGIRVIPMGDCPDWDTQEGCPGHRIPSLDWVICGGESGPNSRPMQPTWARSLLDQCAKAGVPFFFKQWGEFTAANQLPEAEFDSWSHHATSGMSERDVMKFGKKVAGRLLDGSEHSEFPKVEVANA